MPEISLDHLRQLAYRAYTNTSFDPEKRADSLIKQYTDELRNDLKEIQDTLSGHRTPDEITGMMVMYQQRYERDLSDWLRSQSNVASSMITGPSNFPANRMQKYSKWADNKHEQFRDRRIRTLKAISRSVKSKISELESAQHKLQQREKMQEMMTSANKIIRKGDPDMNDKLKALGLDERAIQELLTPQWTNRKGFTPYQLSNNNAEIHRLRSRVASLEAKAQLAETKGKKIEEIEGIKLVHNYEADRVQLYFDGKPDQETITQLKSHGFRWTPSQRAWQRKLTNQAIFAAQNIAKGKGI